MSTTTRIGEAPAPRGVEEARRSAASSPTHRYWLKQKDFKSALFVTGDGLALLVSHWAARTLVQHFLRIPSAALTPPRYILFYLPFLLGICYLLERNQNHDLRRPEKELELAVKGVSYAFLLLVCANFVFFKTGFSRHLMVSWYVLSLATVLAARYGIRAFYGALWDRGRAQQRTLLIGSTEKLFELQTLLAIQRYGAYRIIGIVPARGSAPANGYGLPILGSLHQWREIVDEHSIRQAIIALPSADGEAHRLVSGILEHCLAAGIDVQVYSDLFASRAFNYQLDEFSGFFRFYAAARWSKQVQAAAKAALDLAAGVIGSLVTLAVLPVLGLAIKLEDGGPIFYRSAYVGPDGQERYYRKFRTMRVDADQILDRDSELRRQFEAQCKLRRDPRVTRIGRLLRKYSVDEFPSFFSILRRHISLVGPRTIMQMQKEKYGISLPKLLSVKPGLTGFWQVMGRQLTTHEERVQMDMFYIDHWSIWLDLWIVAKTFWKVLRADGAY